MSKQTEIDIDLGFSDSKPRPCPFCRPFLFNRILVMLVIMAVFTSCVLVVKQAFIQAILLVVLVPLWVARFHNFSVSR